MHRYLGVAENGGRDAVDHVRVDVAAVLHLENLPPFLLRQLLRAVSPSPCLKKNAATTATENLLGIYRIKTSLP